MKQTLKIDDNEVKYVASSLINTLKNKKKIFIVGNGGSHCDSLHFSGELQCIYKDSERKALPCIALNTNMAVVSSWANDRSWETTISRQLEALGEEGDTLIALSTSGKSKNILQAITTAKKMKIHRILLTGDNDLCLSAFIIHFPSKDTPRIQEHTIYFLHEVCGRIEQLMRSK